MSGIVRPSDLLGEMLDWLERTRTQEGYRPALVDMAPDEDIDHPTARQLIRHEPALAALLQEFDRATDHDDIAPEHVWYAGWAGGFKYRMVELVGKWAKTEDPFLRSNEAYDVAYQAFMAIMEPKKEAWARRHDSTEDIELD